MKRIISLILAALLALSTLTAAFAATYTDKDTVKQVQQALNDAGYNCGTPDGIAGKKTAAAITQYQTEKGLEATGTIDDALLEAMGLAKAEETGVEAEAGQSDVSAEKLAEASDEELDLSDPKVMYTVFNMLFLARLDQLGVDIQNEDIGQGNYIINNVDLGFGKMSANKIFLLGESSELRIYFPEESWTGEIGFLDHAALYAYFMAASRLLKCSEEETAGLLELLGEAPPRDGSISAGNIDFSYSSDSVEIDGGGDTYFYLSAKKPDIIKDGDYAPEVPEEIVELIGDIPTTLDALTERYPVIAELDALPEQWDAAAMFADLQAGNSHTFPDMGHNWTEAWIEFDGADQSKLSLTASNGMVTATRDDSNADEVVERIIMYSDDGLTFIGDLLDDKSIDIRLWFTVKGETESYPSVEMTVSKDTYEYHLRLYVKKARQTTVGDRQWYAHYDLNGVMTDIQYTEYQ